jgi:hypothetical protein
MPFIKISGLTTATAVSATNQLEINQNGGSRSATLAQVAALVRASATDVVMLPAGNATSPAIFPTGDTNTGIFFPAADTIAFTEGGVEVVRINSTGNVGIGTSITPVRLTISATDAIRIPSGTTGERPTGAVAYFRFNSSNTLFEGHDGTNWVDFVNPATTQTLTNKRVNPRIGTVASAATITPTADTADQYNVTALATAATIATPSGTPVDGQRLILRFEDNGVARALTWTTTSGAYRAVGVTLPTTTAASKVTYVGCIYNAQDVFWDVVAVTTQA